MKKISFNVRPGEIFAFLGPNGAGKTTTIKMLTTLLRPTSGSIRIDGLNPATHQNEVRRRFGIVFQDPSLDGELTAEENLDLHGVLYGCLLYTSGEWPNTCLARFLKAAFRLCSPSFLTTSPESEHRP